ncbi:MAG TPA: hypothetical protein PLV66_14765, partial [Thermoanaerobaculales bacterium]|nr:hypothetical protein [Thermoanaerobaculales bacterium]
MVDVTKPDSHFSTQPALLIDLRWHRLPVTQTSIQEGGEKRGLADWGGGRVGGEAGDVGAPRPPE